MAARRWRENEAANRCHNCGGEIDERRKAAGLKRCFACAKKDAEGAAERRKRKTIPPDTDT